MKHGKVTKEQNLFGCVRVETEKDSHGSIFRVSVRERFHGEHYVDHSWKRIGVATSRQELGAIIDQSIRDLQMAKADFIGT